MVSDGLHISDTGDPLLAVWDARVSAKGPRNNNHSSVVATMTFICGCQFHFGPLVVAGTPQYLANQM